MVVHPDDVTFAAQLEQAIRKVLAGDDKAPGLYRTIRTSQNWDTFNRTEGIIQGYEGCLNLMRQVARRMNEGSDEPREVSDRMMN